MKPDPKHGEKWIKAHLEDRDRDVMRWEGIVSGLLVTAGLAAIVYVLFVIFT